jgi:hypothetical protein
MTLAPRPTQEAEEEAALLLACDARNRLAQADEDTNSDGDPDVGTDALIAEYQYDGLARRAQKVVAGSPHVTYDYYYNESWQVLEARKYADADPLDQFVWDIRYIDAPVVRFHDGNTDGDLDGGPRRATIRSTTPPMPTSTSRPW